MAVVPAAGAGPSDTADGSTDRPASVGERLLREQREAIAIVGVGLRFPGGNTTLDGFEEFLREGRSGVRPVPRDRWDVDAFTSDDPQVKGKIRAAGCGFLDGIDQFDASFFGISPLEAQYTDPQQRLLLETTWEALENANLNPGTLRHGNGGVYIGASSIDYAMELDSLSYEETDGHLATGITAFPMSGRLSYFLGWRGPSLSTDTACASSLTAVHLAVAGLRGRECDIAVAGAVNAIHHPKVLVMFSHANMLAPDGVCKTFDESADGYVRAEGCGVLILKRLSDAERDGDNVLALVRGTAIGQDGESAGLTVPNGSAQEAVMRKALANARLEPGDIQYVEAHGTGTPLGDPIEMGAISDVFMQSHTKAEPIAVASLKTNVGHMEPVAGIGGVVKTILQMRSGTIFPHLNFRVPSGRIPWDKIPVRVPTECLPWKADIRRAVVSSFGFAGSIAAAVIEEPAAAPPALAGADAADGSHVFTLSAKSKRSLRMLIERYQQFLVDHPQVSAADVCYTSNVGRAHFPMRVSGVVGDRVGLATLLDKQLERLDQSGGSASDIRKVAFLFTGQGSQYPGMGSALYRQFPVFRQHVDTCDELFGPHLGRSIKDLMFGTAADAEVIHQTRYTQPALFTLEYALAKLWISWGVRPNVMIGHSIGEVAAAAVAGLLTLPDAVLLVSARSRLMQSVTAPGGMAAVTAAAAQIVPLLAPYADLALAGLNSPSQCVVSGGRDSLANLTSVLEGQGIQVKQLAVSHAFHSPLMSEVSQAFGEALAQVRFYEPSLTLISNLTGQVAKPAQLATPDYWIRHIVEPVNFEAGMSTVDRRGKHAFVEIGPSRALTALARQCVNPQDHRWHASLDAKDLDGTVIRDSVAQVYAAGIPVSWTSFHQGREARKVALPAYAFDRKRYWLPMKGKRHGLGGSAPGGPAVHPLLGQEVSTPQQVASGIREFSARLSADSPEYLADHVVLGRVVFPGTGYLETLLALQDAVYGDTRRPILDVRVREPLFLALDEATDVRTRLLAAGPGPVAVEIVSRANGSDESVERTHVTAAFGDPELADVLTEAGRHLSAAAQNAGEPDETIGTDDVYAAYTAVGLQYGPAFRRMQKVARYGTDLAVGEMHGLDGGPVEHVPPAILDAATHAYAAIGDDGHSYLPVRYGWFRLFKKPRAQALRILLRTDPVCPDGVDISIDLLALEGDQPVFELRGLGLRRIADGAGGARPSLVHQLRWLRRSLIGQNAAEDRGILVAHCDPAYSAALAGLAPESCAVTFAADTQSAATSLREGQVTDVCWFWSGSPGETKPSVSSLRAECERNYRDLVEFLAMLGREGFGRNQRLWLVTEQAQWLPGDERGPDRPSAAATLWGFGHSLLNEYPAYRSTMIDLPGGEPGLRHLFEELGARATSEFQVAYREGHRRVRRLLPLDRAASGRDGSFELAIKEYGQFSDIKVIPAEQVPPRGDEIQVEVRAAGLNFKDVLNALGMLKEFGDQPLGFEAAGQVVAAGPDATHRVGDEVVINYLGCMKSSVTVPSAVAVPKPANLSFVQAAGLTSVYVTAY
jgi:acyl transferase domain-containing protein